ncbi:MAG: flagellar brake domain-containing protein [SAR324 cluster bacterium]|nr:flagellar brake domain-containing protein [SAR324 cluster bacterium]
MRQRIHAGRTGIKWLGYGLIWFGCSGQSSSKSFNPPIAVDIFKFDQGGDVAIPTEFLIYAGIAVVSLILLFVLLSLLARRRKRQRMRKITDDKVNRQLITFLHSKKIDENTQSFIHIIAKKALGSKDAEDILPMVKSAIVFEKVVTKFKKRKLTQATLKKVFQLRRKLGFDFSHKTVPFVASQMLSIKTTLECLLPYKPHPQEFSTQILDISESRFMVKTPVVKGQPANFKKLKQVTFRIHREDGSEYEFAAPFIKQIAGKINVVVFGHTAQIRQIKAPDYVEPESDSDSEPDLIPVNVPATFDLFSESAVDEHGQAETPSRKTESPVKKSEPVQTRSQKAEISPKNDEKDTNASAIETPDEEQKNTEYKPSTADLGLDPFDDEHLFDDDK